MTRFLVFAFGFVIAGLAHAQDDTDPCGATGLQGLVGQTGEIAELLVFEDRRVRIIVDDQPVTADFIAERLNISVVEGEIVGIGCG